MRHFKTISFKNPGKNIVDNLQNYICLYRNNRHRAKYQKSPEKNIHPIFDEIHRYFIKTVKGNYLKPMI